MANEFPFSCGLCDGTASGKFSLFSFSESGRATCGICLFTAIDNDAGDDGACEDAGDGSTCGEGGIGAGDSLFVLLSSTR